MKKYLLDSVILIDHFNNISQATNFIRKITNYVIFLPLPELKF